MLSFRLAADVKINNEKPYLFFFQIPIESSKHLLFCFKANRYSEHKVMGIHPKDKQYVTQMVVGEG